MLSALAAVATLVAAGCGGDVPGEGAPSTFAEDARAADGSGPGSIGAPAPAVAIGAVAPRTDAGFSDATVTLQRVGEIALPGDRVQAFYRLHIVNGRQEQPARVATLAHAGPGIEVIDGTVVVGELGAREQVTPADTVTLRHARTLVPDAAPWRWTWRARQDDPLGTLLQGHPAALAMSALRAWPPAEDQGRHALAAQASRAPSAVLRVDAVLRIDASVGHVNDALRAAAARIADMRPGRRLLTLALPARDEAAAAPALARLKASPAFDHVRVRPAGVLAGSSGPADASTAERATKPARTVDHSGAGDPQAVEPACGEG